MPNLPLGARIAVIDATILSAVFDSLDAYGAAVYHGTDTLPEAEAPQAAGTMFHSALHAFIQRSGLAFGTVGLLPIGAQARAQVAAFGINQDVQIFPGQVENAIEALATAQDWLSSGEVASVLLLDGHADSPGLAAVLISTGDSPTQSGTPVLAEIAGAASIGASPDGAAPENLIRSALASASLQPAAIGLTLADGPLDASPLTAAPQKLMDAFAGAQPASCALSGAHGGLFSVLKAVWCLSRRVIPGTANWQAPPNSQVWQPSAFYIPTESRTWFTSPAQPARAALVYFGSHGGAKSALILRAGDVPAAKQNPAIAHEPCFLFPISGASLPELLQNLSALRTALAVEPDLRQAATRGLRQFQTGAGAPTLTACVLGATRESLNREIDFAIQGLPGAVEKQADWRTPGGSYFAPAPLGAAGKISFIYPGAFNSYPGLGRDLFYLFPTLYERLERISADVGRLINERLLYPRAITALSPAELNAAEKSLAADPLAMLISGTCLATVFSFLLRETFALHPASAFGYSLGEISMLFASGTWTQADETSATLRSSPLFRTRLAGPQNAVRENWALPVSDQEQSSQPIWENYVLMAAPEEAASALEAEPRVYLTHINTPRQIVIAGDPKGCRRVIAALGCSALQAPFNYALHCPAMASEFEALRGLLSWPIASQPDMALLSAGAYQALPMDRQVIATQLAGGLCNTLDFPRLADLAYADGTRIFIELGAGSNCARWVDESLKDRPHAAFSINRKGLSDHTALLQLLAKLVCHRVPLDLSALVT